MYTSRTLLPAAVGLALLAGSVPLAMADFIEHKDSWKQDVHHENRDIHYCDQRSSIDDYVAGGKYADTVHSAPVDDGVIFERVSFLKGEDYFTDELRIGEAGTYQVTLTDFQFPDPLMALGIDITSATESFGSLIGPGSFTFEADPGEYYLSLFGKAADLGQYGIQVARYDILISEPGNVSAVPVPAAAWLFGSGLVGLAGIIRRRTA